MLRFKSLPHFDWFTTTLWPKTLKLKISSFFSLFYPFKLKNHDFFQLFLDSLNLLWFFMFKSQFTYDFLSTTAINMCKNKSIVSLFHNSRKKHKFWFFLVGSHYQTWRRNHFEGSKYCPMSLTERFDKILWIPKVDMINNKFPLLFIPILKSRINYILMSLKRLFWLKTLKSTLITIYLNAMFLSI